MVSVSPSIPPKAAGDLVLGKYRIVRELGSGAMGRVFEAIHVGLGRRFALKFLRTSRVTEESAIQRLEHEARAAGSLENEHIAAVTDFGVDGAPFLVMEYLEGEDLAALLTRYQILPVTRAVDLVLQACRGLRAAHARRIVHRDLKPANLFITRRTDGTDLLKVIDFGIAMPIEPEGTTATPPRSIGTPRYMAPEQARRDVTLDARTDVYALGVVLFECLSGTWPHDGETAEEVLFHLLHRPPRSLGDLRPDLPDELTRAVDKAVAAGRADRFQRVDDLADAIAPFGPAVLLRDPSDDPSVTIDAENAAAPPAATSRARVPPAAIFASAIAIASGAALLMIAGRRSGAEKTPTRSTIETARIPVTVDAPAPLPSSAVIGADVDASTPPPARGATRPPAPRSPAASPAKVASPAPSSRFDRTNPY
jgi:eukaryotic-like serine/threonine-protein kinase